MTDDIKTLQKRLAKTEAKLDELYTRVMGDENPSVNNLYAKLGQIKHRVGSLEDSNKTGVKPKASGSKNKRNIYQYFCSQIKEDIKNSRKALEHYSVITGFKSKWDEYRTTGAGKKLKSENKSEESIRFNFSKTIWSEVTKESKDKLREINSWLLDNDHKFIDSKTIVLLKAAVSKGNEISSSVNDGDDLSDSDSGNESNGDLSDSD